MFRGALTNTGLKNGKRFAVLLLAFFVSAQIVATHHAAAYGEADHLHDGHPCIVASLAKKSEEYDLTAGPVIVAPKPVYDGYSTARYVTPQRQSADFAAARAPPAV